jgi:hypothetical protein
MTKYSPEEFLRLPSGALSLGLQWSVKTDLGLETHECYQYRTLEDLGAVVGAFMGFPGMRKIRVVTCDIGYQNMRTVRYWEVSR